MLSLGDRIRTYPDLMVRRLCGAKETWTRSRRLWSLISRGTQYDLTFDDHTAVAKLAAKVEDEFVADNGMAPPFSVDEILKIRAYAERCVVEGGGDALKVLFIVDSSLASLRRYIVHPEQ